MTAQKLPLFGGTIAPLNINALVPAITPVFIPPDILLKTPPRTYELHLWVVPSATEQAFGVGVKETSTGKTALAWSGFDNAVGVPVKVLDGYPVRGGVEVALSSLGAGAYPIGPQMFGYYYVDGAGSVLEEERRFIGQPLVPFNAGVGFNIPVVANVPSGAVIHTFAQGRIDEMSLALVLAGAAGSVARLAFEDVSNQPLIPGHYAEFPVPVSPATPYVIPKIPFGGNPLLHHLRVTVLNTADASQVDVHGYFIRH